MILDSLKNSALYEGMHPLFAKAFDYIKSTDFSALPDGITHIDGDELFVNNMRAAKMKDVATAPLEVHDKYIDIQVILEGEETFGWTERAQCLGARGEMNAEKEVQLFDGPKSLFFTLKAGEFCIFFPSDGHAPMIGEAGTEIKKCIIKVKI